MLRVIYPRLVVIMARVFCLGRHHNYYILSPTEMKQKHAIMLRACLYSMLCCVKYEWYDVHIPTFSRNSF